MQGFAADPVYAKGEVFAYVGLPRNLKDLKEEVVLLGAVQSHLAHSSPRTLHVQ